MKKINKTNSILSAIFITSLICMTSCKDQQKSADQTIIPVKVQTARAVQRNFRYSIKVQGTVEPRDSADISARISGVIDTLNVSEGSLVKKGDTLFQTDRKNLENQLSIAEQNLLVARENCKTVKEDISIAEITLKKAEADYNRSKKLLQSKVVSTSAFENDESAWQKAQATFRRQQAVFNYTSAQLKQAENNLQIARKNLADSIIKAPYDGVITKKYLDENEFASPGAKILHIENQHSLEISALISSIYYNAITPDTILIISSDNKEICRAKLSYRAPMIDPVSRTFEIKAVLPENSRITSGALCDIDIILAQRKSYGIASNAVLNRAGGKYTVFVIRDNRAKEIPVIPGFSTDGFTEIINIKDIKDDSIVTSGHYFLNDNSVVEISGGNK